MRAHLLWRILASQGLSSLGTSMSTVALAFMVNALTGSVLHMGGVMAASVLPLAVMSWLGGALLDRYSSRSLMVLADAARAGLIFLMPFVARQSVGLIYVVAALMGVFTALFNPGQIKLVGEITKRESLVRANSFLGVSRDGAELLGYLAGGVVVTLIGYTPAFMSDAASYVLSALLLIGLPRAVGAGTGAAIGAETAAASNAAAATTAVTTVGVAVRPVPVRADAEAFATRGDVTAAIGVTGGPGATAGTGAPSGNGGGPPGAPKIIWARPLPEETPVTVRRLVRGSPGVLKRLWRHPALRTNLLFGIFAVAAVMMYVPNSYSLVLDVFNGTGVDLGTMEVVVGCGLIIGGLLMSQTRLRADKNAYVAGSVVAVSVCLVGVYFSRSLFLSIGLMGLGGLLSVGMTIPSITMIQEAAGEDDKGRLISLRTGFGQMGITTGFLVGGVLGNELGITRAFLVAGVAAAVLSVAIYVPYRVGAGRRAHEAWQAATASGERRVVARRAAAEAAIAGRSERWPR